MDAVFRALADPTRRALLAELRRHTRLNLTALAEPFGQSLATISNHMRILAEAGLVEREKVGRDVYFIINTSVGEDLLAALYALLMPAGGKDAAAGGAGDARQAKGQGNAKRVGK
jgi:DNA-binding transcriptional ArsR family regulator